MESKLGHEIEENMISQNLANIKDIKDIKDGANQIFLPKNSVAAINSNATNAAPTGTQLAVPVAANANNYFKLFGCEISRTTLYVVVAFIVIIGGYYYYKNRLSKNNKQNLDLNNNKNKSKKNKKIKIKNKQREVQETQEDDSN